MPSQLISEAVEHRLRVLEAREAIRACLARYFDLCDVPGPLGDPGQLADLFTADATWRGVGQAYAEKFGVIAGRDEIAAHLAGFLPPRRHFRRNAHLLGSEQLHTDGTSGHGQWMMQQLSEYTDGSAELICARIRADFVLDGNDRDIARIAAFSTERLYAADLTAHD